MKKILKIVCSLLLLNGYFSCMASAEEFRLVVFGLGCQAQATILECLKLNPQVRVVAVCDDHGADSLDFFLKKIAQQRPEFLAAYKKGFEKTVFYPDTQEGLQKACVEHSDADCLFVTSANYNHLRHLQAAKAYASCKKIYMEKPLVRSIDEFNELPIAGTQEILIGLTLRYSSMAHIVVEKLQEFSRVLGRLQAVRAWEQVKFSQAITAFMMSWRRFVSLSGGLLLEKCIHDLDLALFFISSLTDLKEIKMNSCAARTLFNQSQKSHILHEIMHNKELQSTLVGREFAAFQRIVPFSMNQDGIDWPATITTIFNDLPANDTQKSDIIYDQHTLRATCETSQGPIDFVLEVEIGGELRPSTLRGMHFQFDHGYIAMDVMKSTLSVALNTGELFVFDLKTNNSDHADGDTYIAQAILGQLPAGRYVATINDPIVQLANLMGLVSEAQVQAARKDSEYIRLQEGSWQHAA